MPLRTHHPPVTCHNDQHKGKSRGTHSIPLGLLENMELFLWPHICESTKKGKLLAKGINVCTEHIKRSRSRDSFLKHGKENDQKRKDTKEKGSRVR
ncbi:hypothetical protein MC885_004894 [Smutsia gigantea]|nr:hypothetical protein MC885_004894 [Smutsia gigantea]